MPWIGPYLRHLLSIEQKMDVVLRLLDHVIEKENKIMATLDEVLTQYLRPRFAEAAC